MKRFWNDKKVWLTATAVVLAGSISLPSAMAYFTTYTEAEGGYTIELGPKSEVKEKVEDGEKATKRIRVENIGEAAVYARVKVFAGSEFAVSYGGSEKWTEDDGYFYYADPLEVGDSTEELFAEITPPKDYKEDFNVAVVQECTPVLYDENGDPYADWNLVFTEEGSVRD